MKKPRYPQREIQFIFSFLCINRKVRGPCVERLEQKLWYRAEPLRLLLGVVSFTFLFLLSQFRNDILQKGFFFTDFPLNSSHCLNSRFFTENQDFIFHPNPRAFLKFPHQKFSPSGQCFGSSVVLVSAKLVEKNLSYSQTKQSGYLTSCLEFGHFESSECKLLIWRQHLSILVGLAWN